MKKIIIFTLLSLVLFSCKRRHTAITLKFIETSDVHGSVFPWDFTKDKEMQGSLANVYQYVQNQRAIDTQEIVLLDNGDLVQGQPEAYYFNFLDTTGPHFFSRVLNYMKYDAATIGNHDVEAGPSVYNKLNRDFNFPYLAANIISKATGKPYFKPYCIINRQGVKIAVLGLITPSVPNWLPPRLYEGLKFDSMLPTAKKWVKYIQKKEKPDLLVGLFHSGAGFGENNNGYEEDGCANIAREVPGFDILFIGHDHLLWNQKIVSTGGDSVLLIDPANGARKVSTATVHLTWNKNKNSWNKKITGQLVDMTHVSPDPEFMKDFAYGFDSVQQYVSTYIGNIDTTIYSSDALFGDAAFVDLINHIQLDVTGADLSFAAPLSFNATIHAGPLYIKDMFQLYRFENYLYKMKLSGNEIENYLEYSYENWFSTMDNTSDHLLKFRLDEQGKPVYSSQYHSYVLDGQFYNFDAAEGINYTVDVSKVKNRIHITGFTDGRPFYSDSVYTVAVNSYRGSGGGGHLTRGAGIPHEELVNRIVWSTDRDFRHYLIKYIRENKTITPEKDNNWKVIPASLYEAGKARDESLLFDKTEH